MPPETFRDLAIDMLAQAELDARDEAGAWRAVACEAIEALAEKHRECERQREAHLHLLDEYRRLRAASVELPGKVSPAVMQSRIACAHTDDHEPAGARR